MNESLQFDPEILKIEKEIIEFLQSFPLFALQKSINSTIIAYFITRKDLTQEVIHQLTGFSKGIISQELKKLLKMGFIEKIKVSSKGEITYSMQSATKAFLKNFLNSQKEIFDFYNEFDDLKKEMDAEKDEIENLYGYHDVYDLILLFTASLPLVVKVIEVLGKELENLN
jgi:DNA-binding transcriptional regulator GbsR (MarR family)